MSDEMDKRVAERSQNIGWGTPEEYAEASAQYKSTFDAFLVDIEKADAIFMRERRCKMTPIKTKIKTVNPMFGDTMEYEGSNVEDCVEQLRQDLYAVEYCEELIEGWDYVVVEED